MDNEAKTIFGFSYATVVALAVVVVFVIILLYFATSSERSSTRSARRIRPEVTDTWIDFDQTKMIGTADNYVSIATCSVIIEELETYTIVSQCGAHRYEIAVFDSHTKKRVYSCTTTGEVDHDLDLAPGSYAIVIYSSGYKFLGSLCPITREEVINQANENTSITPSRVSLFNNSVHRISMVRGRCDSSYIASCIAGSPALSKEIAGLTARITHIQQIKYVVARTTVIFLVFPDDRAGRVTITDGTRTYGVRCANPREYSAKGKLLNLVHVAYIEFEAGDTIPRELTITEVSVGQSNGESAIPSFCAMFYDA